MFLEVQAQREQKKLEEEKAYIMALEMERREKEQYKIAERRHQESLKASKKALIVAIIALIVAFSGVITAIVSIFI